MYFILGSHASYFQRLVSISGASSHPPISSLGRGASYHPLKANKKRRRCTQALDSESPLVHRTEITKLTGQEPDLDGRAEEADLICLLTDGSTDHTQPPACQRRWNGVAAHGEVGEGAQTEEEMIVIEYDLSIIWNEHAIQVERGPKD